ncbi:polynucleotide 5'-hydroxyl-kinase NOL9 [Linepithema humile]|uniref:polynucleotide 5'-hydroxyl-kinase NOL9 n=1 Tax=Linepithema humile TaxID=83485 RepID=UPI00351F4B8F
MKVKHNERKKKTRAKLKVKNKAKLTVQTKKHGCKNKSMFHKDMIINSVNAQNISLADEPAFSCAEKTATQLSFKCRKQQSNSKESTSESFPNLECKMTDSVEWGVSENGEKDDDWKADYSEEETQEDWLQSILPKEKRNISSPCVVEMLSDDINSLSLPGILQSEQTARSDKETFYGIDFGADALPNKKDTSVIIAKAINPRCDTHIQTNNEQQALPVVLSTENKSNKNKDTSSRKSKDVCDNVNDASSSNRSTPRKQRKKKKRKNSTNCNDDATAQGSFQHDDVSTLQQEIDLPEYIEYMRAFRRENRTPRYQIISASQSKYTAPPNEFVNVSHHMCNKKSPEIYCIRNTVIVIMEKESGFCFNGKLLVKVLYGAVKIYGFVLNNSADATKVYSPRGYNHVAIENTGTSSEGSIEDIWTALAAKGITRDSESKLQIDVDNVQPGMAVLALQNFENNLTLFLQTYFPHFRLFPSIKNPHYYPWTDPRRAEVILQANLYFSQHDEFKYKRLFFDSYLAEDIAERMLSRWYENEWSCTMVMGGKGVGKSTNVRYLINSLLRTTKVVLVDVDPGQAECTPASCISYSLIEEPLMGPNFTHLKTPVYQLFLDEVNIASCVIRYLEGIKMLIERLKGCPVLSCLPIVVNTMGFVRNLGWDIAIFTIKLIRPSFILQIKSSTKQYNYKEYLSAEVVNKQECSTWTFCDETFLDWNRPCEHDVHVIPSQVDIPRRQNRDRRNEGMWNMEPYQQRELAMMSYLSDIIRENDDSFHVKLPVNINDIVPYTASFSSLCIIPKRLFGVPPSHALNVINGNIVALCGVDLTEESSQESNAIFTLRILTQRSSLCTCYGFGIIRGIDMKQQEVFINTPLPISIMQHVNCLAGCIPVPPALLQLHHRAPYVGANAGLPTSRESQRGGCIAKMHKKKSDKSPNKTVPKS